MLALTEHPLIGIPGLAHPVLLPASGILGSRGAQALSRHRCQRPPCAGVDARLPAPAGTLVT